MAAQAQIKIAALYYEGKGVKQNYEEALKWTIKAAKNEDPLLLLYIGTVYYNGHGVKKDYTEALNWFVKAAEHGNAEAQYNVGSMYARGEGTAYDLKKALEWFLKAAEQGFAAAEQALDILVNEETAFDYDEARKWLQKKAEHGDINSLIILGESYLGKKNYAEAVKCFQKAAEQGNAEGQFYFASCCHEGCGIQQDNEKAKFWFQKAAEQGNEEAAEALKDLNRGRTILYITTGGVKMFSEIKETEPLKSTNKQKDQ